MINYIFLDFNGTILDDVSLCLELLNNMLKDQNKKELSKMEYKNIFRFPIKDYYIDAGISFDKKNYEELAIDFIEKYKKLSLNCNLYPNVINILEYLHNKNKHIILLSASERNNLINQCNYYNISNYFDSILGIDNIYAKSKEGLGIEYINKNNIDKNECIFIGDTDHDYLISKEMGIKCILLSSGHQSKEKLLGCNAIILDDLIQIKEYI